MKIETIITVISAIAALLSALYASRSARSAAKSLALSIIDHRERHESVQAQLIDGVAWNTETNECMVAFACNLTNQAVAPNTILSIELHVTEYVDTGETTKLILTPTLNQAPSPSDFQLQPFPSPLNLSPRSTISGWVTFRIPDHFAESKQIDKYKVVFNSSLGQRASVEQFLIRKIEDAKG